MHYALFCPSVKRPVRGGGCPPILNNFLLLLAHQRPVGHDLLIHEVSRSHTTTRYSQYDSSGRGISSSQRPLRDNTQHSQQTDIRTPGEIRTQNLSRLAAADLRLSPRGHWDRPFEIKIQLKYI